MIIQDNIDLNENFDPGWVNIYRNGKLIFKDIPNLTTVYGKEFVLQSITKIVPIDSVLGDVRDYKIDSFSLGNGAISINSTGNVIILPPNIYDTNNFNPVFLGTGTDYTSDGLIKKVVSGSTYIGSISTSTNVIYNDVYGVRTNNYKTTIKYTCRLDASEPSDLDDGYIFNISEAFLYATDPNNIDNFVPFSHVTFENQSIKKGEVFDIVWSLIL